MSNPGVKRSPSVVTRLALPTWGNRGELSSRSWAIGDGWAVARIGETGIRSAMGRSSRATVRRRCWADPACETFDSPVSEGVGPSQAILPSVAPGTVSDRITAKSEASRWRMKQARKPCQIEQKQLVFCPNVNGNRKPHICGNRKLHTSGEDVSGGADILPVMPVGRVGLDAGSGATGVLANTRREAAEPAVTWRLPHAVRPTLSSASADAPASGNCCPGC